MREPDLEAIHEALQAQTDESVLIRWVIMADWADPDGARGITRTYSPGCTTWERDGMLHEGLYGDWDQTREEEGDD